jgi:hypothetical protein
MRRAGPDLQFRPRLLRRLPLARLPANLLQAQRDYFGAHTYERVDQPRGKFFHLDWPEPNECFRGRPLTLWIVREQPLFSDNRSSTLLVVTVNRDTLDSLLTGAEKRRVLRIFEKARQDYGTVSGVIAS